MVTFCSFLNKVKKLFIYIYNNIDYIIYYKISWLNKLFFILCINNLVYQIVIISLYLYYRFILILLLIYLKLSNDMSK